MDKMITITEEMFDNLIRSENRLEALEQGGVDNWRDYDDALCNYAKDFAEGNGMTEEEAKEELYG